MNDERNSDSIKYDKDCINFKCLNDGTATGESRYCDLSGLCRQIDFIGTVVVPMESHYLSIIDPITGIVTAHELYCTGMHDLRPLAERFEDDKVS
jgi:hypothetical protein